MEYNGTIVNKAISFWHFINKHSVEIPIIQRDYAQGRLGKEYLRNNFLTNLKEALDSKLPNEEKVLTLDFVYGSQNKDKDKLKSYPLDGQQRLTTLWLLHWYIALKAGKLKEAGDTLRKFSYETRISSREFCHELCNDDYFQGYEGSIVDFITSRTWFYSFWKQDPTIQSMLRMISGTKINNKHDEDIVDGLEILFQGESHETFKRYWEALISDNAPIVFYYLPLENFGLTDDLYIKMNARGKQLTSFENFKADFIGHIKEQAKKYDDWKALLDPKRGIPIKLDTTWTDIFWKQSAKNVELDKKYFAFLNRYFLNCAIIYYDAPEISETWKLYGEESDDSSLSYDNGFHIYSSILSEDKGPTILRNIEKLFEHFAKAEIIGDINEYLPKWFKEINFIPTYNGKSISTLTQPQRVVFFGICRYFESCSNFNDTHFRRWMRVVCNLVENTTISTIEAMIARMKLINELSPGVANIYDYLSAENLKIESKASPEQLAEEIEKAKQILNPQEAQLPEKPENWNDNKEWNWETAIIEAEKYAFFNGAIRFLFRNGEGEWDWKDFALKWRNAQKYFDKKNDTYKKDSLLLRYFISKFTDWGMFWNGMTYNNDPSSWRYVLLGSKWINPTHELLISSCIEIDADFHSPLNEEQIRKEVQEELVTTKLLDHITTKKCVLSYDSHNKKYMLSRPKAWYDNYVVADKRNKILSSLYGGGRKTVPAADKQPRKIYSDHRIDECDFFWGKNIEFEYIRDGELYVFRWQHWNYIDMYEGNNRLWENEKSLTISVDKIKDENDLIEELNQCIDRYKNYKKKYHIDQNA